MKKAVIVGCSGQDGQLLRNLLQRKNYSIIGIDINKIYCTHSTWKKKIDINNQSHVFDLIQHFQPDEVYYLAAYHHSSEDCTGDSFQLIKNSYKVNVFSYLNFLESIRIVSNETRIFYAASSHIFGDPENPVQDEETKFDPQSIYAITKLDGLLLSRYYREIHTIFSSVGILYNHESHLRHQKFVSKKIVKTAIEIKNNMKQQLVLGNIDAEIDWGYAGDYVMAMFKILNHTKADDYIIASGKKVKLKDFVSIVFNLLDIECKEYVKHDPSLIKRKMVNSLCGNPKKLIDATGWKPEYDLNKLAEIMIEKELENLTMEKKDIHC